MKGEYEALRKVSVQKKCMFENKTLDERVKEKVKASEEKEEQRAMPYAM
ncbi:hypothetical protein [Neptunomonas sp. XY-337]|nr:hypothetical protein [Neptunomonas sp. XY-337]